MPHKLEPIQEDGQIFMKQAQFFWINNESNWLHWNIDIHNLHYVEKDALSSLQRKKKIELHNV